ncbi:50S ribosomal protein L17 [Candidatus Saccharibacteria bacterium]|nr:50S ribosomal protein L17 [Candidatus Saccharibacteria bacterium]
MHRHGYQGRKFGRETDQRRALVKSLAESLVRDESIKTTLPKAKELVPYIEKLITKAKKGDLHNRRQVISGLQTVASAHKLVDEIAPKLKGRDSGHVRITKLDNRRGDNASMARVSFVDDLNEAPVAKSAVKKPITGEKVNDDPVKTEPKAKISSKSKAPAKSNSKKETK